MELSIQKSKVCWLGFSGFIGTLDCLEGSSHLRRGFVVLWGGWGEEKESAPFPSSCCPPRTFYFFAYCYRYFYGDTQREPLRRREWREGRSLSQSSPLFHRQLTHLWKHAKKPIKLIDRTWLSAGGGGSAHKNADARMQAINLRSRTTPESAVTIFFSKD